MRILLIEDDPKIARFLTRGLEAEGHVVEVDADGARAVARMRKAPHDLVLLDLMLPGADGLEILRQIRSVDVTTPVFILSAHNAVEDRVRGLDLGADDYLSKPFSFVELQARLRAFFRRENGRAGERKLCVGGIEIDRVERSIARGGKRECLTTREFQLLDYFMSNPGQVLTRSMLADRVWGHQFDTGTNVVDVYVNYVRRKLDQLGVDPIRTLRGVGYVYEPRDAEARRVNAPHSIRLRLALATAGVPLLTGGVFWVASYGWLESSLDGETRGFALHEAQEVANVVAALRTPDEIRARREIFSALFPEEGVVGFAVFDLDGRLVVSLPREPGPWSEPWAEGFEAARSGHTPYARVSVRGVPSLRTAVLVQYQREPRWLATALVSEQRALAALERYREVFGAGLAVAIAVAISGSLLLLSFALRPLARMVDDAARLAGSEPGGRLAEPPEGSELRELATLLNQLLERDRRTVESLRHFTAHAGHELRTPLARIRSEAELALNGSADQQRECIGSILEETQDLGGVVDALLELARAEEADLSDAEPFPIRPLLEELAEQAQVVGDPREVTLTMHGGEPEPWVNGYRVLLDRAIWNLLDNALKFGRPGGRVELRMRADAEWILLEVADDGPGLSEGHVESLFQAFRRGPGRASAAAGHGLGLALTRVVLRRHGGDVSVRRDDALGGACFSVRLPRVPKPPAPV